MHRVTLSDEAYRAVELEAMQTDDSLQDVASNLILKSITPKTREILNTLGFMPKNFIGSMDKMPRGSITIPKFESNDKKPIDTICVPVEPKDKRPKLLRDDPMDQQEIRKLYTSGMPTRKIAGQIGRPASTVRDFIEAQIEAEDLERR
jgi:hypothetical protein